MPNNAWPAKWPAVLDLNSDFLSIESDLQRGQMSELAPRVPVKPALTLLSKPRIFFLDPAPATFRNCPLSRLISPNPPFEKTRECISE